MPNWKSHQRYWAYRFNRARDEVKERRIESLERQSQKEREAETKIKELRRERIALAQTFVVGDLVRVGTKVGRIDSIDSSRGILVIRLNRTGKEITCTPEAAQKC